jgi:hypothetical protein
MLSDITAADGQKSGKVSSLVFARQQHRGRGVARGMMVIFFS